MKGVIYSSFNFRRHKFSILAAILIAMQSFQGTNLFAQEPQREYGLSIHVMPRRVAEKAFLQKVRWGYMISEPDDTRPVAKRPVIQEPDDVVEYFRSMSPEVQENGIWIVVTHPDAYSEEEKASLERLKRLCLEQSIPLFICRGSQLPNGWQRVEIENPGMFPEGTPFNAAKR